MITLKDLKAGNSASFHDNLRLFLPVPSHHTHPLPPPTRRVQSDLRCDCDSGGDIFPLGKALGTTPTLIPRRETRSESYLSRDFRVRCCLRACELVGRMRSATWRALLGPGEERPPGGGAMPVLLRAGAAQPAVAVGTEDVCRPLLLALRAVLEAESSRVTDNIFIWACRYAW